MSKIQNTAVNLLFPPKCIICGERINVLSELTKIKCVCDKCRVSYEGIFLEVCPACNQSVSRCTCSVKIGRGELSPLAKCFFYKPQKESHAGNFVVYAIKHIDDKRITKMLARELSRGVLDMFKAENINIDECIFTFVPRRRAAIIKDGFDQGLRIADYCAKACGAKRGAKALFSRRGGIEQKSLDAEKRGKNISRAINLKSRAVGKKIRGKTVCIVDDVVTSGATMKAAEKLLLEAGAVKVVFACIARTKND